MTFSFPNLPEWEADALLIEVNILVLIAQNSSTHHITLLRCCGRNELLRASRHVVESAKTLDGIQEVSNCGRRQGAPE